MWSRRKPAPLLKLIKMGREKKTEKKVEIICHHNCVYGKNTFVALRRYSVGEKLANEMVNKGDAKIMQK